MLVVCGRATLLQSNSLRPYGLQPARLLCPWDSPGSPVFSSTCSPPGHLLNPGIEPSSLMVSCIGRRVLYHQHHLGSPVSSILTVISKSSQNPGCQRKGLQLKYKQAQPFHPSLYPPTYSSMKSTLTHLRKKKLTWDWEELLANHNWNHPGIYFIF